MRALLILNPRATSMTGNLAGQVVRELGASLDLRTAQTKYRGHARELAADAARQGYELVIIFGGDGTVNEVVNGLMAVTADRAAGAGAASGEAFADDPVLRARPAIAIIPGGGGNVLARTLGIPVDPSTATTRIVRAIRSGRTPRIIGLSLASSPGVAHERYFTFAAGLGLDAEVVADVERARASGHQSSPRLYMRTALRRYYTATDRSKPALTLHIPGHFPTPGLFMGVVTNSSPWTYVGNLPLLTVPHDGPAGILNSGIDVFGLRRLRTLTTLGALHQMMHSNSTPPGGPDVLTMAELMALTFSADRPIAFHIDGEYLGEVERVAFTFIPDALRVIALAVALQPRPVVIETTSKSARRLPCPLALDQPY
ncbi:MAG TPA: diacylglycerol kinase family protein [Trebonia sp.]|nr:diacylglycerol kinase family protein [Trebonia sp.]